MYYIVCNTSDIPEASETTRTSVDGTQAILDDVQFESLGLDDLDCRMYRHEKALQLMETLEWKSQEV